LNSLCRKLFWQQLGNSPQAGNFCERLRHFQMVWVEIGKPKSDDHQWCENCSFFLVGWEERNGQFNP